MGGTTVDERNNSLWVEQQSMGGTVDYKWNNNR